MHAQLTEDELKTLWAIHWKANYLWLQDFNEVQTIYGQAWSLAQLPDGRRHLEDISKSLNKALNVANDNRENTMRLLVALSQELKKVVAKEKKQEKKLKKVLVETPPPSTEEVVVFVFPPDGSPPIKRPPLGIPPPPLLSTPSLHRLAEAPLKKPSWLARLLAKLLKLPRLTQQLLPPAEDEKTEIVYLPLQGLLQVEPKQATYTIISKRPTRRYGENENPVGNHVGSG